VVGEGSIESIAHEALEGLLEGCQVIGFDFRYLYVNESVARQAHTTRDQLLGRTMMECFPGIDASPMFVVLRRCMKARTHERMENEFTFPDGSVGWFELRFVPVPKGVCILSLDITETKRAQEALARTEEQLHHAQKMEAVGRLAGGVAHDFNNALSVILSCSDMLMSDLSREEPMFLEIEEIRKAGRRAADLTRQLLAFSRQQARLPRVVQLDQILANMAKLLGRLLGSDIELTVLYGERVGRVRVDPGQIEQVVMNLAVNARDAMPNGGKLTLQTKNVELDAEYAQQHLGVRPGPHIMLAVTDTGVGMDKETQARVFEPFFTTKDIDKGTGLGLSTVFGIVHQSGGHLWLYSELGRGSTFKIYFPRTDASIDALSSEPPAISLDTSDETILLVEDDEHVRAVARTILQKSGYTVLDVATPGEALLASEQHDAEIDLLLTDVVLPRMDGPALAERIRLARPGIKLLFMSGYTDEAIVQHGLLDSGAPFLQKPLTPESLGRAVRGALGPRLG